MTMTYRRTTTLTLRLVETIESSEDDFTEEDELPSLPGMTVYDTTAEDVTETRGPGLAKCGPVAAARKKASR